MFLKCKKKKFTKRKVFQNWKVFFREKFEFKFKKEKEMNDFLFSISLFTWIFYCWNTLASFWKFSISKRDKKNRNFEKGNFDSLFRKCILFFEFSKGFFLFFPSSKKKKLQKKKSREVNPKRFKNSIKNIKNRRSQKYWNFESIQKKKIRNSEPRRSVFENSLKKRAKVIFFFWFFSRKKMPCFYV